MDFNVALMASISAVSGGAGVVAAALALRRQKRQEVSALVRTAILEHQTVCPVGSNLADDLERNRKETNDFLATLRNEVRDGLKSVHGRLDTIYMLIGKGRK